MLTSVEAANNEHVVYTNVKIIVLTNYQLPPTLFLLDDLHALFKHAHNFVNAVTAGEH